MKLSLAFAPLLLHLCSCEREATRAGTDGSVCGGDSCLAVAQALQAPESTLLYGGETEHLEWWKEHEELIGLARTEWGRKHPLLYEFNQQFEVHFLNPMLVQAVRTNDLHLLNTLLNPTHVPNVYTIQLFQPTFATKMLDELDHQEKSQIPMRRPNGMNRYGAILADLGFDGMINELVSQYLTRMAQHLFPKYAGPQDLIDHYAFTVRYRPGEDSMLMEHADASVVTVNVCLEPSNQSQVLYFKEHRTMQHNKTALNGTASVDVAPPAFVQLSTPGQAVVHLGQIVHGVNHVHDTRSNLVLWLFGEHGSVRVAEYEPMEALRHEFVSRLSWEHDESVSSLPTSDNRDTEEL